MVVYHLLVTHSVKQHVRQVLGPRIGACEEALASREPTPREASVGGAPGRRPADAAPLGVFHQRRANGGSNPQVFAQEHRFG